MRCVFLEEFEVLQVTHSTYYDFFQRDLGQPILNVKVHYCDEIVCYIYELSSENQWIFPGNPFLLSDVNNDGHSYHFKVMKTKVRKGTFEEFKEKINELAPKILHHPKVRIKAIVFK